MFQLYLKGLPAVVKAGTSFSLTRENPAYSDQEDYTFDVTLPLAGCAANQRIFGPLHHLQQPVAATVTADTAANTFHLIAPPFDLSGSYIITSITEEEVKIQLIAGLTSLNFSASNTLYSEDIYVDELDLGYVFESGDRDTDKGTQEYIIKALLCSDQSKANAWLHGRTAGSAIPGCFFPIYSEEDDAWANPIVRHLFYDTNIALELDEYNLPLTPNVGENTAKLYDISATAHKWLYPQDLVVAPQPYLWFVLERVLRALGYPILPDTTGEVGAHEDNCLLDDWRRNIFIANARGTNHLARMLPHWTVKEFLQQCQNFLGITITTAPPTAVDDASQIYYRYNVKNFAGFSIIRNRFAATDDDGTEEASSTVEISEVIDTHSTEYDDDSETGSSTTGNVAYDDEISSSEPQILLNDDVWNTCEVVEVDTYSDLPTYTVPTDDDDDDTQNAFLLIRSRIYHNKQLDRYYILGTTTDDESSPTYDWCEVDYLGPILRRTDTREADFTLKIIPCRQTTTNIPIRAYVNQGTSASDTAAPYKLFQCEGRYVSIDGSISTYHQSHYCNDYICLTTSDTRLCTGYVPVPAADIIADSSNSPDTNKRDFIEVAYNPHLENYTKGITHGDVNYLYCNVEVNDDAPRRKIYTDNYSNTDIQAIGTELLLDAGNRYNVLCPLRGLGEEIGDSTVNLLSPLFSLRQDATGLVYKGQANYTIADYQKPTYSIDTRLRRTISFTDNISPDTTAIYLIRGRRYVCLKLELTLSPDGLSPLKKGTFAEIN